MRLVYKTDLGQLYQGDVRETATMLWEGEGGDLIITDPPYPKLYTDCFSALSELARDWLEDGGSLVTLLGHYQLPTVIEYLGRNLKYRWIFNLEQKNGNHARMAMGIEVCWKPILWYVKNKFPKSRHYGFMKDNIVVDDDVSIKKPLHKWQQSETYYEYFISRLTRPGELIMDPFCGSGTMAVVAERLGRRWICVDIDEAAMEVTTRRLQGVIVT